MMAQLPEDMKYLVISILFQSAFHLCSYLTSFFSPLSSLFPAGEKASVHVLHRSQGERMGDGVSDSLH